MHSIDVNLFFALLLAHLIGDFWLQTDEMVKVKAEKHFKCRQLYVHAFVVAVLSFIFAARWEFWPFAIILFATHCLFDGVKSFAPISSLCAFIVDQIGHLLVIVGISCFAAKGLELFSDKWLLVSSAYVFCSTPANVLIKLIMSKLHVEPKGGPNGGGAAQVEHAGAYIGTLERWLILSFVLVGNYEAAGLVVAAKSILRFTDKQGPKTEYVLIGTLISFVMSLACAFLLLTFAFHRDIFEDHSELAVKAQCEHASK